MNAAAKRAENKVVKAELAAEGFGDITVGHGTGTARGWLDISASTAKPAGCFCDEVPRNMGRCEICSTRWTGNYRDILKLAQDATGRTGEYHGNIQVRLALI